jgi:PmbA protein
MVGTSEPDRLATHAVTAALEAGADEAEVYSEFDRGVTFQISDGTLAWRRFRQSRGLGLRVIARSRLGYAYTSDVSPTGVLAAVRESLENAAINTPDLANGLPDPDGQAVSQLDLESREWETWSLEAKADMLTRAHRRGHGPHTRALASEYGDDWREIVIVNSRGVNVRYGTTSVYVRVEVAATSGHESQAAQAFGLGRDPSDLDPEAIAEEAASRAVRQLKAKPAATGPTTVILSPFAGCQFFAQFSRGLSGEAVLKGRSPLADRLGDQVGSQILSLQDDPLRSDGPNSRPVDDEGVTSRIVPLITAGRLASFLHTTYTGRVAGRGSTASARRSSYRSTPEVGAANIVVIPGNVSEESLLAQAGHGVYIEEFLGLQASSAISGRYTAAIVGRFIEGGCLAGAVGQSTVAGTFDDTLPRIEALGDRTRFLPGAQAASSPALLIEGMMLVSR